VIEHFTDLDRIGLGRGGCVGRKVGERYMQGASAPLGPSSGPLVIDEGTPHHFGGKSEEVAPIGKLWPIRKQPKEGFIDQRRRFQGDSMEPVEAVLQCPAGHALEFVVDQFDGFFERRFIAFGRRLEEPGDFSLVLHPVPMASAMETG